LDLDERMGALAIRALDRIVGDDSTWRQAWAESPHYEKVLSVVSELRAVLSTSADIQR
jgi:hypothetical protein